MASDQKTRTPPVGSWVYSMTEEHFTAEHFETREQAIEEAVVGYDLKPGDSFWLGTVGAVEPPRFFFGDFEEEQLCEQIGDQVGEVAEDWPNFTPDDQDQISQAMTDAMMVKLKELGHWPTQFFVVDDIEHFVVPEATAMTDQPEKTHHHGDDCPGGHWPCTACGSEGPGEVAFIMSAVRLIANNADKFSEYDAGGVKAATLDALQRVLARATGEDVS